MLDSTDRGVFRGATLVFIALVLMIAFSTGESAAGSDWTLDPASSILTYQSVKKNTIVETNQIRNISGSLAPDGAAIVKFDLNSVDTGVDLRNVRMRFLFFETYKFPTATVTVRVDPVDFTDLPKKRRMTLKLPFRLNLHGIDKDYEAEVVVTMITDETVSIASKSPVAVHVEDFGLLPNIEKLQQAANVTNIVPTASVSFDFIFTTAITSPGPAAATGAANEAETTRIGDAGTVTTDAAKQAYSDEECQNRFEVLSRTGAIYFRSGSARLDPASKPVLDTVIDSVGKCPKFKVAVAAYTDSDGSSAQNLTLSQRRGSSVASFIHKAGIPFERISSAGYGEDNPVAPNDSDRNKARNRRIEFSASLITN